MCVMCQTPKHEHAVFVDVILPPKNNFIICPNCDGDKDKGERCPFCFIPVSSKAVL